MAGRPTKLSEAVVEKIVKAIKEGNFRQVAVRFAGIGERTFRDWMTQGELDPKSVHGEFRRRILEAEQTAEMNAVRIVMTAARGDAKHAQWWLERKFPKRWGRKDRHEVTGKDGGPIKTESRTLDPRKMTDEQLEQLDAILQGPAGSES